MADAAHYFSQFVRLWPRGPLWQITPQTWLGRLLAAFADGAEVIDAHFMLLPEEADPRTTLQLLPRWETTLGLPDTCTGSPDNIFERQIAVWQKLTAQGGQSIAYYTARAAALGLVVEIEEFDPFTCDSYCDDLVNDDDWQFAWCVNVQPPSDDPTSALSFIAEMTCDSDCDAYLEGWGNLSLECILTRDKPAHTTVFFAYPPAPAPILWFDFTTGL